jgi:hypothetical protein
MHGHALALVEAFYAGGRDPDVDTFFDEAARHGVIMPVHFDMIVDVDRGLLPLGKDVRGARQREECWLVEGFEQEFRKFLVKKADYSK